MTDATDTPNADLITPDEAAALQLIAGVPSTSPPPVDLNSAQIPDHSESLGQAQTVIPEFAPFAPEAPAQRWQACTGPDISAVIRARQLGLVDFQTKADVYAFLASKGL